MRLNEFGIPTSSRSGETHAPRKRRVRRTPRVRIKKSTGEGRLKKIVTVTERFHEEENGKETVHKSRGKLPTKRRESLIKAMRAALKSDKTPEHLKAGLRKKLKEWTS